MTIVNNTVNDVAATVLPDAPIDPATGLPVPTIAVGTAAGTSVINDDGTVTDANNVGAYNFVAFTDQGLFVGDDTLLEFATYEDIKSGDGWGLVRANTSGSVDWTLPARIRTDFIAVGNDLAGCGNTAPLSVQLINPDTSDFTRTMTSVISSTYNTGWMVGDIKGAFLADTDDTALVGGTDADRSVNGNDLTVNGTITRTPVASGADLVAYSGFSVSNYLEGTDASYVDTLYALGWEQTGGVWEFNHGAVSTAPIDGLTITGTTLKIAGTKPKALIRLTATTPSAEQLAKIEADEGALFQENAQATLYGASDAVTALAHDPVTDLLHVGTSAGRSIFEGLRRVGNTTTSVSTAISASGGLVVEK